MSPMMQEPVKPPEQLPKMNIDLAERAWRWITKTNGRGDGAEHLVWYQGSYRGDPLIWNGDKKTERIFADNLRAIDNVTAAELFEEGSCGSYACVAGFVVECTGNSVLEPDTLLPIPANEVTGYNGEVIDSRGWDDTAGALLGLTEDEAYDLFAGSNHKSDIKRILQKCADRRGEYIDLSE